MELIIDYIDRHYNEEELIKTLGMFLDNGEDIDFPFIQSEFPSKDGFSGEICLRPCIGTMLHYFIMRHYALGVEYSLSRGANIIINMDLIAGLKFNALELAAYLYKIKGRDLAYPIFNTLRKLCLGLYSTYGLTPLHVDCAISMEYWNIELVEHLKTINVNATVSTESPFWPDMTPILIAAKLENNDLVTRLLDLGAYPIVRDAEGNTPLHYLSKSGYCDKRLFALNANNTFGPVTNESHFHIACNKCPNTLDIVERYLKQGIRPDLRMRDNGSVGLHIAVASRCPELIRLLLEYGATTHKEDLLGNTPVERMQSFYWRSCFECMSLLIEFGANTGRIKEEMWDSIKSTLLKNSDVETIEQVFLSRVASITTMLKEDLVPKKLVDVYLEILQENAGDWNAAEYVGRCSEELRALNDLGLRQLLQDDTIVVKPDFENEFGKLYFFDFEAYPIYGKLLKTKFKRKLFELKDKKRKMSKAIPRLQRLFQSKCYLPHLCAEKIMFNLSSEDLDTFINKYY